MLSIILLCIGAFLLYQVVTNITAYRRHLKAAQESGIYFVTTPIHWLSNFWLIGHPLWVKVLAYLPDKYTQWVDYNLPEANYDYRYEIFERIGHDTYLTVAPGGLSLFTCDPSVTNQITYRRADFPKPTAVYRSLNIFGGVNVVSAEGNIWRQHRKATSPSFTEQNNVLVFSESIKHATAMMQSWLGPHGTAGKAVDRIMDDTMRLSLYVISGAGFGRKVQWPEAGSGKDTDRDDHSKIKSDEFDTDPGHTMSWTYALHCLLETILFQFLLPRWAVQKLPFKVLKKAELSFNEWGRYMKEAINKRKEEIKAQVDDKEELDILRQLVKSQMNVKGGPALTETEIMSNMFVIILAGHETAANSIHFAIVYLALHLDSQRRLQKDLDNTLGGKSSDQWSYEQDLPALFAGMPGAVLAEELRLVPPVINIPKSTMGVGPQVLTVEGRQCTVPADTYISLSTAAAHRNPKYWPLRPPELPGGHTVHPRSNIGNDLEEFHPERWLTQSTVQERKSQRMLGDTYSADGLGLNESPDTPDSMYRPVKGTYLPFSDGARSCLGRRFAQVEVLTALAVLYQNYSIELAVDKYATDEELDKMDINERAEVWQKAAEDARKLFLNGMGVIISLQMRKGSVPVRIVPRGQERFPVDIDAIWKRNNPEKCSPLGQPGWKSWTKQGARTTRVI